MKGKVNLEWDDRDVLPAEVHPPLAFLFKKMTQVTLEMMMARGGERILDIGCGRALDAVELSKREATIIGLEPSTLMINHAKRHIAHSDSKMSLIQAIGECLPFKYGSLDKVMCKGSLDHFVNPTKAIQEMTFALKQEGKAIIAIANFNNLGFKIAKLLYQVAKPLFPQGRKVWEIPPDHTCKLDYPSLKNLMKGHLKVNRAMGVSFLFGLPWWGWLLHKLPYPLSFAILWLLDKVARPFPSLADVIVVECSPLRQ